MSILTEEMRKIISKEKIGEENTYTPAYRTGIDLFDYRNGRRESGTKKIGIDGGKVLTVVGKSGTGKSTLAIEFASSIVEPYKEGQVYHLDFERASTLSRIQTITGWSDEKVKEKWILLNRGIYSESLYQLVKSLAKIKLEKFEELALDTNEVDLHGNDVRVLPPTVILLDSWATQMPKSISEEEKLSGSMSATSIAKTNNAIIKRIMGDLEQANIILIIINHITQKIEINPMVKTQAQVNYFKQDESIPGGTSCIYLANTLLKLVSSSKLEPDKEFGIKGFKVNGELIKSRSNSAGNKFEMVFDQEKGFDNVLTNYLLLKSSGAIGGAGRGFYLNTLPDVKFSQKTVKEKYETVPEFKAEFDRLVEEIMEEFLSGIDLSEDNDNLTLEENIEGNIWRASDGQYYKFDEKTEEVELIENYGK
ncbi:UvsX-like recombinase [Bacillus phage AR9]|uniref:UvsX-like recombinase n=1 Tax=Bacillus phage AR9 TaxID=1815509 RepID=A0A172JHZ1_BPPB1|nr:UvsX-like recombinase [Bacillus phage AR9]AMS01170.1 UvsX-like recombinase [Bacillus phage AR9]